MKAALARGRGNRGERGMLSQSMSVSRKKLARSKKYGGKGAGNEILVHLQNLKIDDRYFSLLHLDKLSRFSVKNGYGGVTKGRKRAKSSKTLLHLLPKPAKKRKKAKK
jgi:hypothetical protein